MIWDELTRYDQIPICRFGGSKYNLTAELELKDKEETVHQFLTSLDDEGYGIAHSSILNTKSLLNMNQVYSRIIQQEHVLSMSRIKEEKEILMESWAL